jgi:hypothetical protein
MISAANWSRLAANLNTRPVWAVKPPNVEEAENTRDLKWLKTP